jgi:hypothetical protein
MRRIFALIIATVAALSLSLTIPQSASALGGEWLGCHVLPGTYNYSTYCHSDNAPPLYENYEVTFMVQAESAPSTYSWAIPSIYQSNVSTGCTSTTNWCTLSIPESGDTRFWVSVTLTQGSATVTLSARAHLAACFYC